MGKRNVAFRVLSRVVLRRGTIPAAYGLPHSHTRARYTRPRSVLLPLPTSLALSPFHARASVRTYTRHRGSRYHLPFPESPHWHPSRGSPARLRTPAFVPFFRGGILRRTIVSQVRNALFLPSSFSCYRERCMTQLSYDLMLSNVQFCQ